MTTYDVIIADDVEMEPEQFQAIMARISDLTRNDWARFVDRRDREFLARLPFGFGVEEA